MLRALEPLEARQMLSGNDPVISEFVASNQLGLLDDYNTRQDWIEIYNPSGSALNLGGWHLTDSASNPGKSTFPAGTSVAPGGYLVVFADSRNPPSGTTMVTGPGGKLHTNFSLSNDGEYLALTRPDNSVVYAYDPFPAQSADVSYGPGAPTVTTNQTLLLSGAAGAPAQVLVPAAAGDLAANWNAWDFDDSGWPITGQTGIGYDNDSGASSYGAILETDLGAQMSGAGRNTSAFARLAFDVSNPSELTALRLRMRYDDGFVAYLNGSKVAEANAPANPAWNSAATGTVGKNAGFVVFDITAYLPQLRAGRNVLAIQGLNDSNLGPDFLLMPELVADRLSYGAAQYMTAPTPGAANAPGAVGKVKDTEFSIDRGFFTSAFDLRITSDTAGATIRYTTDGSTPTPTSGTIYTGPVRISKTTTIRAIAYRTGWISTNVDAQTYVFPDQVLQQTGAGLPPSLSWGHAGPDWAMDPDIVGPNAAEVKQGLLAVPSVSLSMPWNDWFNPNGTGLYNSNNNRVDHAVSFEMINPDGRKGVQANAAVQLQGGSSDIGWRNDKLSMDVKFQEAYGPSSLDYDVFGDGSGATKSFDHLILDAVFNGGWTYGGGSSGANQRGDAKYIQDQYVADLQNAAGGIAPHGRFVNLYLNGLYWGMYYLHEKPDENFAAAYMGGNSDDYDVMKHNSSTVVAGSSSNYAALLGLARKDMTIQANYDAVLGKLDVVGLADYIIINFYLGNTDWAHQNWYASFNRVDPNGKWRFHSWDAEHVIVDGAEAIAGALSTNVVNKNDIGGPTEIHTLLRANPEYRALFADRVHKLLLNPTGVISPTNAAAKWQSRMNEVSAALYAESARWGDNINPTTPYTVAGWQADMSFILTQYFPQRAGRLVGQLQGTTNPAYPSTAAPPPTLTNYGGAFATTQQTTLSMPSGVTGGAVYYSLDGLDPRQPGGTLRGSALSLTSSTTLTIPTSRRILARYRSNSGEWSALVDAVFIIGNTPPPLRISEIMYNPAPPATGSPYTADDFEFIELANTGSTPLNPSGFAFTDGIRFTFPLNSLSIQPGARVVLARNPAAFATRYPGVSVLGAYTGLLANGGERLTLATQLGQVVESITYADGWFDPTDGGGYSLTALNPAASDAVMSTAAGWRASLAAGGTPGTAADDAANNLVRNAVVINEVMANAVAGATNWIELRNTTNAPIDVGGWWLSDTDADLRRWQIPAGTVIPANGYVSFGQTGGFGSAFALSGQGADVYLTSNDGAGNPGGYRDHVDFGAADPGVSWGRYVKSTGAADIVQQSAPTRDAANAAPLVSPVVINEVMYNPLATGNGVEYVELRNTSNADVSLNAWKFTDGISYTFPSAAGASVIPANGYALVVSIDPAVFRATYNIPAGVPIFGPFTGQLSNGGEKLTLARPSSQFVTTTVYVTADRVTWDNKAPWPAQAAGGGPSIARVNAARYGNDAANWRADATGGTGGADNALAPVVFDGVFGYGAGPTVTIRFGKAIASPGLAQGVTFVNLTTGQTIPAGQVTFSYDPATNTATWALPATLADGNYRATLAAAAAADLQGRPLDGNSDGTAGDDYAVDFYHLAGDATRDRVVNFDDLLVLAKNYNKTGATFATGDFTGDGLVNFDDLLLLAKNYNKTIPLAGAPMLAAAPLDAKALAAAMGVAASSSSSTTTTTTTTTTPPTAPKPTVPPTKPPAAKPTPAPKPAPAPKPQPKPAPKPVAPPKPVATRPAPKPAVAVPPPAAVPAFAKKRISARVFD